FRETLYSNITGYVKLLMTKLLRAEVISLLDYFKEIFKRTSKEWTIILGTAIILVLLEIFVFHNSTVVPFILFILWCLLVNYIDTRSKK
ncbi:hypothetical protein, partial [Pediococcus ethanolidurans]|uniref:hypothetical protein n=1 Tax=Pediococcus ethanolidurans TaxID=319653 RepID=UPI0021E72475